MRTANYCISDANINSFPVFYFRIHSKTKINWSTWIYPTTAWANCSPIFSPTWIDFYGSISPTTMWVKFMVEFLPETASWEFCTWTTTNSPGIFFFQIIYIIVWFIFHFSFFVFWSKYLTKKRKNQLSCLFIFCVKIIRILPENDSLFFRFLVKVTKKRNLEWTRQKNSE